MPSNGKTCRLLRVPYIMQLGFWSLCGLLRMFNISLPRSKSKWINNFVLKYHWTFWNLILILWWYVGTPQSTATTCVPCTSNPSTAPRILYVWHCWIHLLSTVFDLSGMVLADRVLWGIVTFLLLGKFRALFPLLLLPLPNSLHKYKLYRR